MKRFLPFILIAVLVAAFIYGHFANQMDAALVQHYYRQLMPEAAGYEAINDRTAKAVGADGAALAYLGVSSDVGYGGPIMVGTILNQDGSLQEVQILEHKETPAYINKITKAGYFRQYEGKKGNDALTGDYDIELISGATLSTRAIAKSVQEVAHTVVKTELNQTPQSAKIPWQVGVKEIAVTVLVVLSILMPRFPKLRKYRLAVLGLSVVVLGFWLNRSLSMGHISALFMGYFPSPRENLIWYLILAGALLPALFSGKNLYCTYVCPFCGVQEGTHLLSRMNLPLSKYGRWLRVGKEIILFLTLLLAFLLANPSFSSFEPFGTIFGWNGTSSQWYLLFIILVTSFLYRRFWCVALCPVGTFLDKAAQLGRKVKGVIGTAARKKAGKVELKGEG